MMSDEEWEQYEQDYRRRQAFNVVNIVLWAMIVFLSLAMLWFTF